MAFASSLWWTSSFYAGGAGRTKDKSGRRGSGGVEPARTTVALNLKEDIKDADHRLLGVRPLPTDPLRVGEGNHGKAVRPVQITDRFLQGVRSPSIPVAGDQDQPLALARLPDDQIGRVSLQSEVAKRRRRQAQGVPDLAPGV